MRLQLHCLSAVLVRGLFLTRQPEWLTRALSILGTAHLCDQWSEQADHLRGGLLLFRSAGGWHNCSFCL